MRRSTLVVLAMVLLGSCSERGAKPRTTIIKQIEAKLTGEPCIGSLGRWHREYAFQKAVDEPTDRNLIQIWFKAAGPHDPAGRFVRKTIEEWPLDDSPVDMAFGRYDVRRGELILESCGPNFGGGHRQAERIVH